jgi:hypothetical protein
MQVLWARAVYRVLTWNISQQLILSFAAHLSIRDQSRVKMHAAWPTCQCWIAQLKRFSCYFFFQMPGFNLCMEVMGHSCYCCSDTQASSYLLRLWSFLVTVVKVPRLQAAYRGPGPSAVWACSQVDSLWADAADTGKRMEIRVVGSLLSATIEEMVARLGHWAHRCYTASAIG